MMTIFDNSEKSNEINNIASALKSNEDKMKSNINSDTGAIVLDDVSKWQIDNFNPNKNRLSEAAAMLGRKGGSAKSEKKTKSSRENGKKGGRPKTKKIKNI